MANYLKLIEEQTIGYTGYYLMTDDWKSGTMSKKEALKYFDAIIEMLKYPGTEFVNGKVRKLIKHIDIQSCKQD